MSCLKKIINAPFVLMLFSICLFVPNAFAQDCIQENMELETNLDNLLSKRLISYNDMQNISESMSSAQSKRCNLSSHKGKLQALKEKRLATVNMYLRNGIKNEGTIDLTNEQDYLNGKPVKFKYAFDNVFTESAVNPPNQSTVKIPPPTQRVPIKNIKPSGGSCENKINQNFTVNLNNTRNQDSVGWCYAFAASDLVSYRLNKKISAVSLFDTSDKTIEQDVATGSNRGGDIKYSITYSLSKRKGFCLEADLPSSDFKFCTDQAYLGFLNDILTRAREKRLESDLRNDQCLTQNLKSAFPGVDIGQMLNYTQKNNQFRLVEYLYESQCKVSLQEEAKKIRVQKLNAKHVSSELLLKRLHDQINNNDVAAIGYDYNKVNQEKNEGAHGSLVVGRRTNPVTGSCEFLVRNSWGKDCTLNESPGLSCHKDCAGGTCRDTGHFWVEENRLSQSLIDVTYLE